MRRVWAVLIAGVSAIAVLAAQNPPRKRSNVVVFVADGLRHGSVNPTDTPAFWRVRTQGVNFENSHGLFPTLTLPNAAAIATGHYVGDTGQFANTLYPGYPAFNTGNFGLAPLSMTASGENNQVLGDLNDHHGGNYLRESSLLAFGRSYAYNTAAVGKLGPTGLQDVTELAPLRGSFRPPATIIIDGATGGKDAVPLTADTIAMLDAAGLGATPPSGEQPTGNNTTPGTLTPNLEQERWLVDAVTKAILPRFVRSEEPFLLVFWSGDPDETQHAQGDSLNSLVPGVNGPTSKAAVRNADRSLQQILDFLDADPELRDSTNVFVTADHGFSTLSLHTVDAQGRPTTSYSAGFTYRDATGRQEVNDGFLPRGFLAIDLAHALNLPLFDPDTQVMTDGVRSYAPVDPAAPPTTAQLRQRPSSASGLIGGRGRIGAPGDARVVVSANAIYVPGNDRALVRQIVGFLATQDYVGGLFVNDRFGRMPGALPMSAAGLLGGATVMKPAVLVSLKSFATDPANPVMTGVMVGATQQQGQGAHGSLSRANTFNNMAAIGPGFKRGFTDPAPVGNADVVPTLAHLLGATIPQVGSLRGRVLTEALAGGSDRVPFERKIARSRPAPSGASTVLVYQQAGDQLYFDEACFTSASGPNPCR